MNNIIEESKKIYKKIDYLNRNKQSEKYSYIWRMGTDFFLHLIRWENLFIYLNNKKYLNIKIKWHRGTKKQKGFLTIYNDNEKKENFVWGKGKKSRSFLFNKTNIEPKNELGDSTIRQFIEIGISFGYVEWKYKSKVNEYYHIILNHENLFSNKEIDKDQTYEFIKSKIDKLFDNFDFVSFGPQSNRDVLLGIHMAFLYGYCVEQGMDFINIFNGLYIWERSKKNKRQQINSQYKKSIKKHYKTQTTIQKAFSDSNSDSNNEMKELLLLIHKKIFEKYNKGWQIKKETMSYQLIMDNIKKNRIGQDEYRRLMLNAKKRLFKINNEYILLRHDLSKKIISDSLVEAAHVWDYKLCNEDEKYDPENGLLLDPAIHKYFDKDILCFNECGQILVKQKYEKEIKNMFNKSFFETKIRDNILTEKTKSYIKKRNKERNINFQKYKILNQLENANF